MTSSVIYTVIKILSLTCNWSIVVHTNHIHSNTTVQYLVETVVLLGEGDCALTVEVVWLLSVAQVQLPHLLYRQEGCWTAWGEK